jgi:ATP-binding cassette subfamily B protein
MGTVKHGLKAGHEIMDRVYSERTLLKRMAALIGRQSNKILGSGSLLVVYSLLGTAIPIAVSKAIDVFVEDQTSNTLVFPVLAIAVFGIFAWLVGFYQKKLGKLAAIEAVADIQERCFRSVIRKPMTFFHHSPSGKLISRVTGDTEAFGNLINLLMGFIGDALLVLFLLSFLFTVHSGLAFIVVVFIPVILLASLLFRTIARKVSMRLFRMIAEVNASFKESLAGMSVTKNFCKESYMSEQFDEINEQTYRVNLAQGNVFSSILPLMSLLTSLGVSAIVYFGAHQVLEGQLSFGELYLFVETIQRILMPVSTMSSFYGQIQDGVSASERILSLMDEEEEAYKNDGIKLGAPKGEVKIEGLNFSYTLEKKALQDITLHIRPGEKVALVGHTGSGKSSLARLLIRFHEFQEGEIRIDGHDIRSLDMEHWRRQIGYVSQTPFLFNGTVLDNIRYGNPLVEEAQIEQAINAVGNGAWLEALPDGLATEVGERGTRLSMGQRQLVSLIRILLKNPALFILDEATANIDPFTEKQIQQALRVLMNNQTSIIIAHRLSTILASDCIVVMSNGRIVEKGDHDTLMRTGVHYKKLYDKFYRHQQVDGVETQREVSP